MKKNKIVSFLLIIVALFSLIVLLTGVSRFYSGFHNIDLSKNISIISQAIGFVYTDTGSDGQVRTMFELYTNGLEQIEEGLWFSTIGAFFLGFSLLKIHND